MAEPSLSLLLCWDGEGCCPFLGTDVFEAQLLGECFVVRSAWESAESVTGFIRNYGSAETPFQAVLCAVVNGRVTQE